MKFIVILLVMVAFLFGCTQPIAVGSMIQANKLCVDNKGLKYASVDMYRVKAMCNDGIWYVFENKFELK